MKLLKELRKNNVWMGCMLGYVNTFELQYWYDIRIDSYHTVIELSLWVNIIGLYIWDEVLCVKAINICACEVE